MNISIEELGLSARALNCCLANGISTLADLRNYYNKNDNSFAKMQNCGKKTILELNKALEDNGDFIDQPDKGMFLDCINIEELYSGLSDAKRHLITLAFDKYFLDSDSNIIKTFAKRVDLTPIKALSLVDFIFKIIPNQTYIDFDVRKILLSFRNEVSSIIAMSDYDATWLKLSPGTSATLSVFYNLTDKEIEYVATYEKRFSKLPLFMMLYHNLIKSQERNDQIFLQRMGVNGNPISLEDLGTEYDLTRERIRQIVLRAHRKAKGKYCRVFCNGQYPFLSKAAFVVDEAFETINKFEFSNEDKITSAQFIGLCSVFNDYWSIYVNGETFLVNGSIIEQSKFENKINQLRNLLDNKRDKTSLYPLSEFLNDKIIHTPNIISSLKDFLKAIIPNIVFDASNYILLPKNSGIEISSNSCIDSEPFTGKRRLQIIRPDNTIIETGNSNLTFCQFVKEIGWEKVKEMDLDYEGEPLFGKVKINGWYKDVSKGWYLCTRMPCHMKIEYINRICAHVGLKYSANMIDVILYQ